MTRPTVLVYHADRRYAELVRVPKRGVSVRIAATPSEAAGAVSDAEILYAWKFPPQLYAKASRLKWMQVMGAGVDWALVPELPPSVQVTRAPGVFGPWMAEYVLGWCSWVTQKMKTYRDAQRQRRWDDHVLPDRLGDKTWMEVLREHNTIVRDQIRSFGGYEVKSEGDGFMVAFQSARKALACAAAIQGALAARNEGASEPVKVRMGLHAGEVIKEGEDFFGRNVIMAARVASQAHGGEILASSVLKALVEGSDVSWGEKRTVELKGLSGDHEIWPVDWPE